MRVSQTIASVFNELVVITGAGRGIGRSIAVALGESGRHVLCISQSTKATETAAEICRGGGKADSLVVNIADYEVAEKAISEWVKSSGYKRISTILAAAVLGPSGPLESTPLREWERTLQVNVMGNLAAVRAVLPYQIENQYARILFFAGGGAAYAYPIFPAYAASKTALVRIVENLAVDLEGKGDHAVAILAPGAVATDTLTQVRASGGYVKTVVGIEEPTRFATEFVAAKSCAFSGCFVHVRDTWPEKLNTAGKLSNKELWKLRRVE